MEENTEKLVCRQLAALLVAHGVKRVFVSPGSRNAPLIVAIARQEGLETSIVVDERAAAFMAMGYSLVSEEPVAIVCTSGTALLNYAPAVAEAFYRKVPLIVISADRPMEWIDQDDSQTLRQPGALANYVKLSCDIPEITTQNLAWYANRRINDAILSAVTGRKAPVHINIQLDAPLGSMARLCTVQPRVVRVVEPNEELAHTEMEDLAAKLGSSRRVMIIAGFNPPDDSLNEALAALARRDNVVVMTETIANLHSSDFVSAIDATLTMLDEQRKKDMAPDVVITFGGALVSRFVKEYLRRTRPAEHWHVGVSHTTIDCFQSLTLRIEMDPHRFFSQIAALLAEDAVSSDYSALWREAYAEGCRHRKEYVRGVGWSDMKAFSMLLPAIPKAWNLQLSNGTPIRYAQLFGDMLLHRCDCNRGVSGIDGCSSTAIGAALAYSGITLLITGDTSAQYDVGALCNATGLRRFKVIVMCNGGGGIFRFISSTSRLAELDQYFAFEPNLPLRQLADGYGLEYYEADGEDALRAVLPEFIAVADRPALLAVKTPPHQSAEILKSFFLH